MRGPFAFKYIIRPFFTLESFCAFQIDHFFGSRCFVECVRGGANPLPPM